MLDKLIDWASSPTLHALDAVLVLAGLLIASLLSYNLGKGESDYE